MKIKIYRGTKEIGGTCIELTTQNGKKLWIDLGLPLDKTNPDVNYATENSPDALLISHPHQDHYGLMNCIDKATPIYIGQVSLDLINAAKIFLDKPPAAGNFKTMTAWKRFIIDDTFKVEPFLVDHSSPEAFAFLIEADGKRVFYSGDFRATGRKSVVYEKLIKNPPSKIDLLLLEGTMAGRSNEISTEIEVENKIFEKIKTQQNVSFVVSSAQNIDRFVSVYRACKKAKKNVVVDVYNSWVLDMVKKKSPGTPDIDWKEIKVFNHPAQMKKINTPEFEGFKKRVEKNSVGNAVFKKPSDYVYFLRCPNEEFINAIRNHGKINLIYSQWDGYLKEEYKMYFTDTINKLCTDKGIEHCIIHTSGHATMKDLIEFARALNPKKIIPIHTGNPELMKKEFEADGINNVYLCEDNLENEL